jgi:hypothetical protein
LNPFEDSWLVRGVRIDRARDWQVQDLRLALAHKHPAVRQWLARHPRWIFQFTPTSASWLNAVEAFFATLTKRRLKHGVFRSVVDLQAAINRFLEDHNANSKPFQWVADPDKIIAAVKRGHQALDSIH